MVLEWQQLGEPRTSIAQKVPLRATALRPLVLDRPARLRRGGCDPIGACLQPHSCMLRRVQEGRGVDTPHTMAGYRHHTTLEVEGGRRKKNKKKKDSRHMSMP